MVEGYDFEYYYLERFKWLSSSTLIDNTPHPSSRALMNSYNETVGHICTYILHHLLVTLPSKIKIVFRRNYYEMSPRINIIFDSLLPFLTLFDCRGGGCLAGYRRDDERVSE